jgi:hypothetical protein
MPKRVERDYSVGRVDNTQADGFFTNAPAPRRATSRVVSVSLSQVMPDRYQPRPILPLELKNQFYAYFDENLAQNLPKDKPPLSIYQAAAEWLKMSKSNQAVAERVKRLLSLGDTVEQVGQIKPATGKWSQNSKGEAIFALESGERRMWSLALSYIEEGNDPNADGAEEPKIEVLEVKKTSRERQVVENRHAETPTAVARAREVASLVLEKQEIHPNPNSADDYEYFRQVTEIKRLPSGFWDSIEKIMGISDFQMRRLLRVLQLPTPLLEKADMYNLPERVLREIIQASPNSWDALINAAVLKNLTAEDIEASVQTEAEKKDVPKKAPRKVTASEKAARKSVGFISSLKNLERSEIKQVVAEISFKMKYDDERLYEAAEIIEDLAKRIRTEAEQIRQDKAYE